ncbi:LysR family transcriptional regulator [Oligoflexaceae bacterium]|nr:LysR family transcriptional regulator [Oligoflexaceae bacterium]
MDDLYLLRLLLEGHTLTSAAGALGLTQPAASQRVKKIETAFSLKLVMKMGRNVKLTTEGIDLCNKAIASIALLEEKISDETQQVINIGSRPEVGQSWLWPALKVLRKKNPRFTFHVHLSSGEDIIKRLGTGELDAVLTSAPLTTSSYKAVEVAHESYVFVGHAKLKSQIKSFADLSKHILIEHDRSFPFMRYFSANDRARLSFYDVWFMGSSKLMVSAIESGFGVGVVPKYLVQKSLNSGALIEIPVKVQLDHDFFRVIYRTDRDIDSPVKHLSEQLIKIGLR